MPTFSRLIKELAVDNPKIGASLLQYLPPDEKSEFEEFKPYLKQLLLVPDYILGVCDEHILTNFSYPSIHMSYTKYRLAEQKEKILTLIKNFLEKYYLKHLTQDTLSTDDIFIKEKAFSIITKISDFDDETYTSIELTLHLLELLAFDNLFSSEYLESLPLDCQEEKLSQVREENEYYHDDLLQLLLVSISLCNQASIVSCTKATFSKRLAGYPSWFQKEFNNHVRTYRKARKEICDEKINLDEIMQMIGFSSIQSILQDLDKLSAFTIFKFFANNVSELILGDNYPAYITQELSQLISDSIAASPRSPEQSKRTKNIPDNIDSNLYFKLLRLTTRHLEHHKQQKEFSLSPRRKHGERSLSPKKKVSKKTPHNNRPRVSSAKTPRSKKPVKIERSKSSDSLSSEHSIFEPGKTNVSVVTRTRKSSERKVTKSRVRSRSSTKPPVVSRKSDEETKRAPHRWSRAKSFPAKRSSEVIQDTQQEKSPLHTPKGGSVKKFFAKLASPRKRDQLQINADPSLLSTDEPSASLS